MFWIETQAGEAVNLELAEKIRVRNADSGSAGKHEVRVWFPRSLSDENRIYDILFAHKDREVCVNFVASLVKRMMPKTPVLDRAPNKEKGSEGISNDVRAERNAHDDADAAGPAAAPSAPE